MGAAPRRHEGDGGAALRVSLFGVLFVEAEEEEEEQEEAPQVLFWCAASRLWARVPLSLFFFWCAVFPSVDDRPKMLDIMAGTEQKYSYVLLMCKVGFPGYFAPRAVFPSLSSGPRCSASWPVWTRRIFRHVQGLVCWYLTMSLALCSSWLSQAQGARHHGWHGPRDSYVEVHRCSSWTRSLICPLVCYEWRRGPDNAENCLAIPHVQFIITVVVTPFRCAVAVLHGPDFAADHRDSTVVRIWWSMSLFADSFPRRRAEADSMVRTLRRTFFFSSLHGGHVSVVQVVLAILVVVNDRCARLRLCRILLRSRSYCSSSS